MIRFLHRVAEGVRRRHPVLLGALLGIVGVFGTRACINETRVADWLVRPLLIDDTTGGPVDAIVVPAAGTNAFCTPNAPGIQRTIRAAHLYQSEGHPPVVFSGGLPSGGGPCAVAETMATLARQLGVPSEKIRVETNSSTTWENALRSDAVLQALGAKRVRIVTDALHMRRTQASFARFGYDIERSRVPVPLAYTDNVTLLYMAAYETAALAYYRARGYISSSPASRASVPAVRRDEFGRQNSEEASRSTTMSRTMQNPEGQLVILGASYAGGWPLKQVGEMRVVNAGASGEQAFEMLRRFDTDVVSHQPRAVLIWGFINDVFRTQRPEMANGLARVRDNMTEMVARARASGIEPILATEVTLATRPGIRQIVGGWWGWLRGRESYASYINRQVIDTNAWLREYARSENILLLDLERVVADRGGLRQRRYATEDGSHITPEGYAALTAYALPRLDGHFRGTQSAAVSPRPSR